MEFHNVVYIWPKMQPDEFSKLVEDIRSSGLREPIYTYQGKIIDGRHRFLACQESGVTPRYEEWNGEGSLILFVASLNQHRRHLDAGQKAMVALELEKQLAVEAKANMSIGGTLHTGNQHLEGFQLVGNLPTTPINAVRNAAKLTGVNHQYVTDAKKIVTQAPELREAVMNRTISLPDAKRLSQQEETKRTAILEKIVSGKAKNVKEGQTIVRQEAIREQSKVVSLPSMMQLLHGNFSTIDTGIADGSVDLLFTDPPYHEMHLGLWDDLAQFAHRVLRPGGILLAYSGQLFLPQVLSSLSTHLEYCWLLGIAHSGGHIQIWKHHLWNDWKPIVMFSNGKANPDQHEWFMDLYKGDQGDKIAHEWSQGEREAAYYIEKLSRPGALIVDPMCGSGTILRAAHKLERRSIGIEIDAERYQMALGSMKAVEVLHDQAAS